jgi:hypothetical protein
MLECTTDDGVTVTVEILEDQEIINDVLNHSIKPEALRKLHKTANRNKEVFFDFVAWKKDEWPIVRYHLFHLNYTRGEKHVLYLFSVDKDHVDVAEKMAQGYKQELKTQNGWDHTDRAGMPSEEFFKLPPGLAV